MDAKHLVAVEKCTLALAAAAIAFSMLVLSARAAFGVAIGAGLMSLNAYALRRIGVRAFRTFKKPGLAVLLFNLKMGALLALVWVLIRYLHVDPVAFVFGISVFPAAILVVAIRHAFSPHEESHNG